MISVVIPTLDAERGLIWTLAALVPAAAQGLVREVIIADGGSNDHTLAIANEAGAQIVPAPAGRGGQLAAGARLAKSQWLLFLHSDTCLQPGWEQEATQFIERVDRGVLPEMAASFQFALDDIGVKPRLLEQLVALRCLIFKLPYGDQGLLMPKRLYQRLGGYRELPLMEDVDLVRRIGRARLALLRAKAVTSAARYQRDGYLKRVLRNAVCLSLYYLRVPPRTILKLYGR